MLEARGTLRWTYAIVLSCGLTACSLVTPPKGEPSPAPQPPPARAPTAQPPRTYSPLPQQPSLRLPEGATAHIALLVPVSGRLSSAANSVLDGFMTAYFQIPQAERPQIQIYDTAQMSVGAAVAQATRDGVDLIAGPLSRDEVTAAALLSGSRPPILALNFLPAERPAPHAFYQFALSPEDEAREVAHRALAEGRHRAVVLGPTGEWGTRVLTAFRQELIAGGGTLLAEATFDSGRTDYGAEVMQVLRLNESRARHKRLEAALGTQLEFEPRRRGDIDFIFAPGQPNTERLLRPQLRYHFAGDIPTFATSDAFEPDTRANQDLEGLIFPDMPWMLGGEPADTVREAARSAWPVGGPRRGRLYAFGYDAFQLALALRSRSSTGSIDIQGLTGRLTLAPDHRIHRELVWGALHNGQPRILSPAVN